MGIRQEPCHGCRKRCERLGCEAWRGDYLQRQKRINAFAWQAAKDRQFFLQPQGRFVYRHPDAVRRYLHQGFCTGCPIEKDCKNPCQGYLHWYDMRMALFRKRLGAQKTEEVNTDELEM